MSDEQRLALESINEKFKQLAQLKMMCEATEARLEQLREAMNLPPWLPGQRKIKINKRTHRFRFESESEESVTFVIEPRDAER